MVLAGSDDQVGCQFVVAIEVIPGTPDAGNRRGVNHGIDLRERLRNEGGIGQIPTAVLHPLGNKLWIEPS